jgi:arylsulfatase A-like enzyme
LTLPTRRLGLAPLWSAALACAAVVGMALTLSAVAPSNTAPNTQPPASPTQQAVGQDQPNIVLINLDDADWDLLSDEHLTLYFPNIKARFSDGGLRFTNLHVADPLCGPSRASLFRGQYPHNTGVRENPAGWQIFYDRGYTDDEIGMWMRRAGYRTGLVGKYCHEEYPLASHDNAFVPPGWDTFHASLGDKYYELSRNIDGKRGRTPAYPDGYRTDLELVSARQFLSATGPEPFFLYLAPFAPHITGDPAGMVAPRHVDLFDDERIDRTPDFNELDVSDKSQRYSSLPLWSTSIIDLWDSTWRDRLRAMAAVDEMVGQLFDDLDDDGLTDSTFVILTSDNGYQLGHHRLSHKKSPFDRDTRVPFFITGPGIEPGSANHLLSHIDIVPTVLELGGAPLPHFLDGRSFAPLLADPTAVPEPDWQRSVLVENVESKTMLGVTIDLDYRMLRRYDDAYIEYTNGDREYYNLATDPFQLENRHDELDPPVRLSLEAELARLVDCAGPSCHSPGAEADASDPIDTTIDRAGVSHDGTGSIASIAGSASDDLAVDRVEVVVRHVPSRRYWDGTTERWLDEYVTADATLGQQDALTTTWSIDLDAPAAGELWVSARAYDIGGNSDPVAPTTFIASIDDVSPPTVNIVEPSRGQVITTRRTVVSGTVEDDIAVDRLQLVVEDTVNERWWNGADWQPTHTTVPVRLDHAGPASTWSYRFPTPYDESGDPVEVWLGLWAADTSGNTAGPTGFRYLADRADYAMGATIVSPGDGAVVDDANTTVTGTVDVRDRADVDRVEVVIVDLANKRWWDGSQWQTSYTRMVAAEGPLADGDAWSLTFPTPESSAIRVSAWARDDGWSWATPLTGGDHVTFYAGLAGSPNTVPPRVVIASPALRPTLGDGGVALSGAATDDDGVDWVELVIRDLSSGQWWNGESWQPDFARVPAQLDAQAQPMVRWRYLLPGSALTTVGAVGPGPLYVSAWAADVSGNINRPPPRVVFSPTERGAED